MTDKGLKQIGQLLEDKLKLIHGEVARVNRELIDLNGFVASVRIDQIKFEKELARLDSNIVTLLERVDHPEKGMDSVNEKLDILIGEMTEVKTLTKVTNELVRVNREITKEEIKELKKHVGLPS
ncbi:hypothetical protein HYS93_02900 [Candidatus Daviesbacteria bacterium]|nr:hypothetical protein [Candidatus Daviesbacteria bacterium]